GSPYCYEYSKIRNMFSPMADKWLSGVRLCLQRRLVPIVEGRVKMSCIQLKDYAFQTHAVCYGEGRPNVCDIHPKALKIVGMIMIKDMRNPYIIRSLIDIMRLCILGVKPEISLTSEAV